MKKPLMKLLTEYENLSDYLGAYSCDRTTAHVVTSRMNYLIKKINENFKFDRDKWIQTNGKKGFIKKYELTENNLYFSVEKWISLKTK